MVHVFVVLLVGFVVVSNRTAIIVVLETPVSPHFASGIFIAHVRAGGSGGEMGHTFFAFFNSSSLQYSPLAFFRSPGSGPCGS